MSDQNLEQQIQPKAIQLEQLKEQLEDEIAINREIIAQNQALTQENNHLNQEIHALRELLETARESERRFREIAENVTEVFFLMESKSDQILYVSPTYEQVWGRSCQSLYDDPQSWLLAIHPDDCMYAMVSLETQFRTGEEFQEQYRIIRPDGSICWVWVRAFPIRDEQGKVNRFVGIAADITERKLAEEALQKSEEQFRLTFELAPIGMALTNLEGKFKRVNTALCQSLKYSEEELLKLSFKDITDPDDFSIQLMEEKELLEGVENNFQIETRHIAKDGYVVDALLKMVVVRDELGKPLHFNSQIVDITDRKKMERQLVYDAFHDGLTGLPNRALFMDRLGQALKRKRRESKYLFAVLFLDLDRFKVVNDSVGHSVGDKLLVALARRLETCLRPTDTVARLGGDEFTILLDNIKSAEETTKVADRIYRELNAPFNLDGYEVFASASIGIALGSNEYENPEELLRDADLSMYRAKEKGKARYEVFDKSLHTRALKRLELENDLRRGIEREEFKIYYQAITSLVTGKLEGFEALVRWQHPSKGLISPLDFIPIAEETGLIIPLGSWILKESCRQIKEWQDKYIDNLKLMISVNISGKQFRDGNLIYEIDKILTETGLDPHQLKLEITESVLMENTETATQILLDLRSRNIKLSIDDFGTGYSSLSYLHRFPVNTLKIDRSFINQMQSDAEHAEIVRAIVTLAHILNMDVVAEGIETDLQLNQLKSLNCEYGQGYLFSKPINSQEAEILIQDSATKLLGD
jgi:diguanylate cyclase (GGDEF)-like protein/PAS domain S-box-containing protein